MEAQKEKELEEFRSFLRMDYMLFGNIVISELTFSRVFYALNHIAAGYGLYLLFTGHFPFWDLFVYQFIYWNLGGLGVTAGAHRYWTHKSYKANLPLRILLMLMCTINAQWSIYKWVLDHRLHHKFNGTDKDPYNSKRGFWFSHVFWALSPKHPELQKTLKSFHMPDLEKDPVILFNSRHIIPLTVLTFYVLPVWVTMHFWGVPWLHATSLNSIRWVYISHITSTINSFAHMYGSKPYNMEISATDNAFLSFIGVGEGWHNYHHTFPWDYRSSEFGWRFNLPTIFIDVFAWIGWAQDLKTVEEEVVREKMRRSGENSTLLEYSKEFQVGEKSRLKLDCESADTWGWDDKDVSEELRKMTTIFKPSIPT